jgi:hypothetical protein
MYRRQDDSCSYVAEPESVRYQVDAIPSVSPAESRPQGKRSSIVSFGAASPGDYLSVEGNESEVHDLFANDLRRVNP